ncbi:hypothetical protein BRD00_10680 [Halobacteriales archaeon QS_8_69_26]|nr:MAG: hypothetical protein BRD00_10680 [Halobacteriales archaeon QS_8_69_26]
MATKSKGSRGGTDDVTRRVSTPTETALTNAIVDAVAALRDEDPTDIEFKLYEHVDTESLARLARDGAGNPLTWTVTFPVEDVEVTVSCDEDLRVRVR